MSSSYMVEGIYRDIVAETQASEDHSEAVRPVGGGITRAREGQWWLAIRLSLEWSQGRA